MCKASTGATMDPENISEKAELTPINRKQSLTMKKDISRKVGPKSRKTTTPSRVFEVGDGVVHEILELNNGNIAITGIKDNNIRIFDFITGRLKKMLVGHQDYIMGIISLPTTKMLISYSCDKSVKLWSTKNFKLMKSLERPGLILSLHIMSPEILLIQEAKSTSFFVPSKITEVVSIKNG